MDTSSGKKGSPHMPHRRRHGHAVNLEKGSLTLTSSLEGGHNRYRSCGHGRLQVRDGPESGAMSAQRFPANIPRRRLCTSSDAMSSVCVATHQRCPKGSSSWPERLLVELQRLGAILEGQVGCYSAVSGRNGLHTHECLPVPYRSPIQGPAPTRCRQRRRTAARLLVRCSCGLPPVGFAAAVPTSSSGPTH